MMMDKTLGSVSVAEVIRRYGRCLELIPMDKHFQDISIGLYAKDDICTVWTFSRKQGARERIRRIRDQLVLLGGMLPLEGSPPQARFPCGKVHLKPLKFLLRQAVVKNPDYAPPPGEITIQDTRTDLVLEVKGRPARGRWIYQVSGRGEAQQIPQRLRAIVTGFVRYGGMEKESETEVSFSCGRRHHELVRLLLPYSRNISAVQSMMESEALRGQMTTSTLGFTSK